MGETVVRKRIRHAVAEAADVRVGAAVLARMSSRRLPGKVLRKAAGRPLIERVIARLERVEGLNAVAVATSDHDSDEPLRSWAAGAGILVHVGPLDDVLARLVGACERLELDAIARVNADSPWLDPDLLGAAVARMRTDRPDLVSNLVERRWPYGVAAEVAGIDALRRLHGVATLEERSHATRGFYARPGEFSILGLRSPRDLGSGVPLTIDTEADLVRFERVLAVLGARASEATLDEVVRAAREVDALTHETMP